MAEEEKGNRPMNSETSSRQSSSVRWIAGGVVLAIVVALLVAVLAGNGDSEKGSSSSTEPGPASSAAPVGGPGENQPVTVTGQVLDPLGSSGADVSLGAPAPALAGFSFDGTPIGITPGDGTPYMIVFLAHWCPHCNAEVPRLVEWNDRGLVPEGLKVVGVSTAVAADRPNYPPSQWIVDKQWPFTVMADSEAMDAAAAYGVDGFPFFVVVGADGAVKVRASGEQEIDAIDALVRGALASD